MNVRQKAAQVVRNTKKMSLQRRVVRNLRRRGVVVRNRRQWGSKHPAVYAWRLVWKPVTRVKADTLWQHITVTFDSGTLVGDFDKDMQTIERIGYERFKSGFSYNWGVDMTTGMVGVGMPLLAKGTHTVNDKGIDNYSYDQNAVARAVAVIGMPGKKPSDACIDSISHLFAAMMEEGALTNDPDYNPHSLVADKDCPTDAMRAVMPRIKRQAHSWK